MKSVEFCYWLQGLFELGDTTGGISSEKTDLIKRHLAMVFHHEIDPSYGTQQIQQALQKLHDKPAEYDPLKVGAGSIGGSKDGALFRC